MEKTCFSDTNIYIINLKKSDCTFFNTPDYLLCIEKMYALTETLHPSIFLYFVDGFPLLCVKFT